MGGIKEEPCDEEFSVEKLRQKRRILIRKEVEGLARRAVEKKYSWFTIAYSDNWLKKELEEKGFFVVVRDHNWTRVFIEKPAFLEEDRDYDMERVKTVDLGCRVMFMLFAIMLFCFFQINE